MAQTVFESLHGVKAAVGRSLGASDWLEVTQERVDRFADAIGGGWIDTAGEPARRASPCGGPPGPEQPGGEAAESGELRVAPGYLTLALTNLFLPQIVEVRGASLGVNYGAGRVRFPAAVPVGSRVRGVAELVACDDIPGGVQTTIRITVEVDGGDEPACVVDSLSRWLA